MMRPTRDEMKLNLETGITLADGHAVIKLTGPGGKVVTMEIPLSSSQAFALSTRLDDYACHGTDAL